MKHPLTGLLILCLSLLALGSTANDNLIANGDFEMGEKGWGKVSETRSYPTEADNTFLRLTAEPGKMNLVYRLIKIPAGATTLKLSYSVRYADIKPGEKSWFDGRILMNFKNADKKKLKEKPSAPAFRGTSVDWLDKEQTITVPEGAVWLEFMPCLFQATAGTLDFDMFNLTAVMPDGN